MRKNLIWLGISVVFLSCEQVPLCISIEDENKGQIEEYIVAPTCYDFSSEGVVILDDSTLQAYRIEGCSGDSLEVDFTQFSLIAHETTGKCQLYNERQVSLDHIAKTLDYRIDYTSCGLCKDEVQDWNLVKVKKIDSTYTVSFDVGKN